MVSRAGSEGKSLSAIRHARQNDARAIAGLWNAMIEGSLATFNSVTKSEPEVAALVAERPGAFFVAEAEAVVGFATFWQFRAGAGYAKTMEHTVVLAEEARGRGLGRALMAAVLEAARARGAHVMVAAITGDNPEGEAFHAAIGFERVGFLPEVGRKAGAWRDLVLMQLRL
jgi:L-amino acid N-acyltransferase YncA